MVHSFCKEMESTEHAQLLKTCLPSYVNGLCQLASHCPEDVVFIVVDSLQLVAKVFKIHFYYTIFFCHTCTR